MASPAPASGPRLALAATLVGCFLLAATVRLPGLGARGLGAGEQTAFVESQGFRARATVPIDRRLTRDALPQRTGLLEVGSGASGPPLHVVGLALWTRAAGTSETALRVPSELAGSLAASLAALIAGQIAGPCGRGLGRRPRRSLADPRARQPRRRRRGAPRPSPLRLPGPRPACGLDGRTGHRHLLGLALGLALGLLASSGVAAFAAAAPVPLVWLARRSEGRAAAGPAALAATAAVALLVRLGLARSPLDFGEIPTWIPEATASGILRCTGASFTRVAGLEYQLAVSHAREVIPLTVLFVGLMAWGAARLPARARGLLVPGALLPFVLGATLALATGRVTPLQAPRLLAGCRSCPS